jgi:ABC-type bacteriocin/lantibiotic exporter with double-glycine peptidase domain
LMIARAVVSQPQILLMDEATSALDNRTQSIVSEALQHLNATRVVIAHRLSTVIDADCIYVVDAGRVVQSGTYEELLNTEGVFQTIAKPQLS